MKKHILSIIVGAICLIAVGVSVFLLIHSQDDTVYCDRFTLKTRQVTINVGDKLSFNNNLFNISPSNCEVEPTFSCNDDNIIIADNFVTSNTTGSYNIVFSIQTSANLYTKDTFVVKVVDNADYTLRFTKNQINVYLSENTPCDCLQLYATANSTFDSKPNISYSVDNVCQLDLDKMSFVPIALGSTTIQVTLSSAYGLSVKDEIIVNVVPMPAKTISLPNISDSVQVARVNSTIEIEYYVMLGNSLMPNQSVTLSLFNYDTLVMDKLFIISTSSPRLIFKITSSGSYSLIITSNADTNITKRVRFEIQ